MGAVLLVALSGGVARAQTTSIAVNIVSGPPGSAVVVKSAGPCTLPAGVIGPPRVYIALSRNGTVITNAYVGTAAGGSWKTTVTIPSGTPPGPTELSAACYANEQAPHTLRFTTITFTVTGGGSALARTGDDSVRYALLGICLLIVGVCLATLQASAPQIKPNEPAHTTRQICRSALARSLPFGHPVAVKHPR